MSHVKKILAIVLALALSSLALAGCAGGANGQSGGQTTLVVWGEQEHQAIYEKAFEEINNAFMEKYPDIKIDYQWSGTLESITTAVQTDTLPDVFYSQGTKLTQMAEMAANGFLLPLGGYGIDTSRFPVDAVDYATVDGELYCSLPSFLDYALVYYNADIFAEHELEVPSDFDEFLAVCDTLLTAGVEPMAYGGNGWLDRYWLVGAMGPAYFNDALLEIKEGSKTPDLSAMVACLDAYQDLIKAGYLGENFEATDFSGAQLTFTNGDAAMVVDGTWNSALYEGMNIGCFAMPGPDGLRYAQSGPSQSTTYSVSAKTEHPESAAKYIEFLSSLEAAQIMFNNVRMVPMVDGIESDDPLVVAMSDFDVIGQNIYGVLAAVGSETSTPADLFVNELLPKVMTGELTGQQAVDQLLAELAK